MTSIEAVSAKVDYQEKRLDNHNQRIDELVITDREQLITSAQIAERLIKLRENFETSMTKIKELETQHNYFKYVIIFFGIVLILSTTVDHETWKGLFGILMGLLPK